MLIPKKHSCICSRRKRFCGPVCNKLQISSPPSRRLVPSAAHVELAHTPAKLASPLRSYQTARTLHLVHFLTLPQTHMKPKKLALRLQYCPLIRRLLEASFQLREYYSKPITITITIPITVTITITIAITSTITITTSLNYQPWT